MVKINMEIIRLLNSMLHMFIRHFLNTLFVFPTIWHIETFDYMGTCTLVYSYFHIFLKVDNPTLTSRIRSYALFIAIHTSN